jgi:flagellar basal-body rod protein FlgG
VEESNVNAIEEMVNMINLMRAYEANQKVIQTEDSTLEKAVNEVGRI